MRKVVDSNQLRSAALRQFLSKSEKNFVVLTDYLAMEAYQGDTLTGIYRSMEVLSDFPTQVVVLKSTRLVCGLSGRGSGLQRRLIDERQSAGFPEYVRRLAAAREGDVRFQQHLLEHGREASRHLNQLLADAQTAGETLDEIAQGYSKEERTAVRTGQPYPSTLVDKTVQDVIRLVGAVFKVHPNTHKWPKYAELPNTFLFRAALCIHLLAQEWGAHGGAKSASVATLRNDFVDAYFAAYATFFDGLMSADTKMLRIHQEARIWLSALFGCQLHGGTVHI